MKRCRGQITVFMALSALSLFSLFCVCLEGARSACLDYLCSQAADSALRSVFAAYQGETLRDYGLLMSRGREFGSSTLERDVEHYAEKYLSPAVNTFQSRGDRVRMRALEASAKEAVYMTDGRGAVYSQAVLDYMKTSGLSLLLQEVLGRLGLYSEAEGGGLLETIQGMILDKDSSLEGILGSYQDIKEQAAALQEEARLKAEEEEREYEAPPGSSEDVKTDWREQIKSIWKSGLIAVITGSESLSDYSWNQYDLPSRLPEEEKTRHLEYGQLPVNLTDRLLIGEYLQYKMNCYTEPADTGSRYETEYVLTGRKTDKGALEQVVGELLLIRMGFNLAYLSTDAEKVAMAELTAIAIMSFLALPQLVLVLKWVLLSAWALAESIVDLRGLVRGKKIPLWKTKQSWRLSSMKLDLSAEGGSDKRGLSYEDYLRILFPLGNPSDQAYRMMDVMQARLRQERPELAVKDYLVQALVSLKATAAYLYVDAPLIRDLMNRPSARQYTRDAFYAYGRR